ncbi:MAG: hypothetical protein GTO63_29835, partial [Anaerolineae bacterium]|nr:hypothetical protein [Anaerolineae bacterium]NIN98918.1 hypothetical protein [Anaerolineae bacterium]NIQ81825.1 hypothetical protein [Anaerolineae bacterium]
QPMERWEYDITTHAASEVLEAREQLGHPPDPQALEVVYCDTEGVCFFDEAPNPYVEAIIHILNEKGKEGWKLVQVTFRQADFIGIWRREL